MTAEEEFNQLYSELKHKSAHRDMMKTCSDIMHAIRQ
jgi:hypothetical protein